MPRPSLTYALAMSAAFALAWAAGPLQAQTPPAPAAPQPAPAGGAPTLDLADEQANELIEAVRNLNGIRIKSLFLTQKELGYVRMAQRLHTKSKNDPTLSDFNETEFLKKFSSIKNEAKVTAFTYPQFFLDSIVYHAVDNWAVWISNGTGAEPIRLTPETPPGSFDIRVLEVEEDYVTILWRPLVMEKVSEVWRSQSNDAIQVDEQEGTVVFTLRPNQTFTSYLMRVVEGRVQPVTIGNTPQEVANPAFSPDAPPAEGSESQEGLGGLINQYENLPKDAQSAPAPAQGEQKP